MLSRLGIAFSPLEARGSVIVRLTRRAERLGLARVDVGESWTHNPLGLLAELARRTSRIGLGTAVLTAWGRSPQTLAERAAGLQACSRGRFTLGLGTCNPPLGGLHQELGAGALRSMLAALRERLESVPIALAALTPRSIQVAGELADEWMPFLWARSHLDVGLGSRTRVVPSVPVALARDEAGARRLAASWLRAHDGPVYPRLFARFGHTGALGARAELPGACEALARDVTLFGTYADAPAALDEWFGAGASAVRLVLPPGLPEPRLAELLDVVAGAAR